MEQKAPIGISGGGRTPFTDRYREAYVWRLSIGSETEDGPERLRALKVFYPRLHNGRIEAKQAAKEPFQPFYSVMSEGKWYYVSQAEFEKLSVGQTAEFVGAGTT